MWEEGLKRKVKCGLDLRYDVRTKLKKNFVKQKHLIIY